MPALCVRIPQVTKAQAHVTKMKSNSQSDINKVDDALGNAKLYLESLSENDRGALEEFRRVAKQLMTNKVAQLSAATDKLQSDLDTKLKSATARASAAEQQYKTEATAQTNAAVQALGGSVQGYVFLTFF